MIESAGFAGRFYVGWAVCVGRNVLADFPDGFDGSIVFGTCDVVELLFDG